MMTDASDMDLVREFARNHSEAAFAELVRRHLNLVYSVARRCTRSDGDAQDVTQAVFVILARKAAGLCEHTLLTGWLYETTRHTAAGVQRTNARRHAREQEAFVQSTLTDDAAADWHQLAPHLEAAMSRLGENDRTLLALRFYENKSGAEAAALLGIREAAAHKRTARALEKLRKFFTRRGIELTAAAIAAAVSANSVQAAPAGLAAAITAAALSGTTISATTLIVATKSIAMTTIQKTLITLTLAASVGVGIYAAKEVAKARTEVQTIRQQQAPLAKQILQLQRERDEATNRLANMADELAIANRDKLELMNVRNEKPMLRQRQAAIQTPANVSVFPTLATVSQEPSPGDIGRELGMAVVRGDAGAFDKLLAESVAEHQNFLTNNVGLSDGQRGELAAKTFAPINAAFKVIEDAAVTGNQSALDAVIRAIQIPELNSLACESLGMMAGQGNDQALELLIHPDQYGFALSSAVDALSSAADNGNQKAIDALAAVAANPTDWPLWMMTANGLAKAAAAGNQVAIDSLISMSSSTNQNVQNAIVQALRGASANQNANAMEALRTMGIQ